MDITSPTTGAATPSASSGNPASAVAEAGTTLNSDFETFLKMLTAQMKNQDPLNPVDSTEFASQLAAFSTVEQQVMTNDLLTGLGQQLGVLGMGQLQGWVGMTARAEMPVVFDGSPVSLTYTALPGADLAQMMVRDSSGSIVQQQGVPIAGGDFVWKGLGEDGTPLPAGTYSISVDSFQGQDVLGSTPVQSQARIIEAQLSGGSTLLVMEGGQRVLAADILGLRHPA
ncbi:flagellar hook capping FlgD N-terminal domain-containing protein [Roseovarius sp. M141]|uniref:flagellar hook capping FlgD N-terminal domain-containing protein n=1 Tax=Roseovarius sp. M141 TaxID=2583806 RepID=UPI0020CE3798|nr:flagellar hook capping FlgD N-terminal domain-containing protein [Roseovarius sp. M141]MCQ0091845.1 flagellar basal body rod modification protein [Roseovarius sp. M141]